MDQLLKFSSITLLCGALFLGCSEQEIQELEVEKKEAQLHSETSTPNAKPTGGQGVYWGVDQTSGHGITSPSYNDHMLYYTHDSWSYDKNWIIFISNRDDDWDIYALRTTTKEIYQLTNHSDFSVNLDQNGRTTEDVVLSKTKNTLYYILSDNSSYVKLMSLDFGKVLNNETTSPVFIRSWTTSNPTTVGGISLDANEAYLYTGLDYGTTTKLQRVRISDGVENTVHTSYTYSIGHICANPWVANELIFDYKKHPGTSYNHTPNQRIHYVKGDGSSYRKIYQKISSENPTHETWVDSNTIGFNMAPGPSNRRGYYHISKYNSGLSSKSRYASSGDYEFIHNTRVWGTNKYILDMGLVENCSGSCSYNTISLFLVDLATGSRTYITGSLNAHAHQRVHPNGSQLLYENRTHLQGYNLNLRNL